jgi:hypothetical protein
MITSQRSAGMTSLILIDFSTSEFQMFTLRKNSLQPGSLRFASARHLGAAKVP